MRFKIIVTVLAVTAAMAVLAAPADAVAKKKHVVTSSGHTVFMSRGEDNRTRTKIIIQKRSYLDPGTETFPGENLGNNYVQLPNQRASSVLDNTIFGLSNTQSPLPGPWTLPGKNNPWLQY